MKPLQIISVCCISEGRVLLGREEMALEAGLSAADFLQALYRQASPVYPKWYKMDKLSQLGLLAAELLLRSVDLGATDPFGKAIVLQSAHGCLDTDLRFVAQLDDIPSPATFVYTLPNIVIGEISIKFDCKGEQAMLLCEKPDAGMLEAYVHSLFAEGHTSFCLCGWLDAFGESLSATMFAVTAGEEGETFNKENIQQYFDHEQG